MEACQTWTVAQGAWALSAEGEEEEEREGAPKPESRHEEYPGKLHPHRIATFSPDLFLPPLPQDRLCPATPSTVARSPLSTSFFDPYCEELLSSQWTPVKILAVRKKTTFINTRIPTLTPLILVLTCRLRSTRRRVSQNDDSYHHRTPYPLILL